MTEGDNREQTPTTKRALGPDDVGQWLVFTQGSVHLWDLDARTYRRQPGNGRSRFEWDGRTVRITHVGRWPVVGQTSLVWFDDPARPDKVEQWRQSSTIREIRPCTGGP